VSTIGSPSADSFPAELGRKHEDARVEVGHRDQVDVQGGNDRVVAAATAERPEEILASVGVDGDRLAGRGDQLDRPHVVAGEPEPTPEPAHPTAERVADHADVDRGARQRAEAVRRGGLAQLEHPDPGLDPSGPRDGIDLDASHALRLDQDRVDERTERHRRVARPLGRDAETIGGGEADRRHHVVGTLHQGDRRGLLVGRQIPGRARIVPVTVVGGHHLAGDRQLTEVGHGGEARRSPKKRQGI
jgi:hypothetical protein